MLGQPQLSMRIVRSNEIAEVEPKTHADTLAADCSLAKVSARIALHGRLLRRHSPTKEHVSSFLLSTAARDPSLIASLAKARLRSLMPVRSLALASSTRPSGR